MKRIILTLLFLTTVVSAEEYTSRTWTAKSGSTIDAKYVSSDGRTVSLEQANGKQLKISKSKLCAKDIEYLTSIEPKVDSENNAVDEKAAYLAGIRKQKLESNRLSRAEERAYRFELHFDEYLEKLKKECLNLGIELNILGGSQLTRTPSLKRRKYRAGRMNETEMSKYESELLSHWKRIEKPFCDAYMDIHGTRKSIVFPRDYPAEPTLIKDHEKEIAVEYKGIQEAIAKGEGLAAPKARAVNNDPADEEEDSAAPYRVVIKNQKRRRALNKMQARVNDYLAKKIAKEKRISEDEARNTEEYKSESQNTYYASDE